MGGENDIEFLEATKAEFIEAIEKQQAYEEILVFLKQVMDAIREEQQGVARRAIVNGSFLETKGIDTKALYEATLRAQHASKTPNLSVEKAIDWLLPMMRKKRKVVGDALQDVFAEAMFVSGQPMDYTQMIEYLDEQGIEKPGVNFRNNIIGMITKAPDRFRRVARGTYYLTRDEERRQMERYKEARSQ